MGNGHARGRDWRRFFRSWLKDPRHVGAVAPSGKALGRLMAAQVDPERPGHVVELGPGTGAITRALLSAGIAPKRLVLVERDPQFHALLRDRFPGVTLVNGDAGELASLLRHHGIERINAVVSSLPMLTLPPELQTAVLEQSFRLMDDDGVFVQFTYSPAPPIPRQRVAELGLVGRRAGRAWLNLPPASVWRYARNGQG